MSKVLSKFKITSCTSQRDEGDLIYGPDNKPVKNEDGSYQREAPALVSQVKLSAVQGEPFGKYTPFGTIEMSIKNPAAAQQFQDAWDAYVRSTDPKATAPEFYVMFQRDHGKGWEE